MLDLRVILNIKKKAITSIKSDSDGKRITSKWQIILFHTLFHVIPYSLATIPWLSSVRLPALENYLGTSIAIFTGLFFSLLLGIGDKIRVERENINIDQDSFHRFKENLKQIAQITLYTIVLGVFIFSIMLINTLSVWDYDLIEKIFTSVVLLLMARFILSIFFILQRFVFIIRDEIDNIL